ncbi:hypothetical protein PC1_005 [Pseudomonas phage PC1]
MRLGYLGFLPEINSPDKSTCGEGPRESLLRLPAVRRAPGGLR